MKKNKEKIVPTSYIFSAKAFALAENVSIRQRTVKETINEDLYEIFLFPLSLTEEYFVKKDKDVKSVFRSIFKRDAKGNFKFSENGLPLIHYLLMSLSYFFESEDIKITEDDNIIINNSFLITDNNFEKICEIILYLNGREKPKKLEPPKNLTPSQKEVWMKTMIGRSKKSKKDSMSIYDILNILIHFGNGFSYENTLNLTILQLYNTLNILMEKDQYERFFSMYSSGNFQFKDKDRQEHWISKIKTGP